MKILAFAASTSTQSINKQVVTSAARLIQDGAIDGLTDDVTVEIIDLNDYEMPIYSTDREAAGGIPQQAHDFFAKIGEADALIVSLAEHNGNYTAAYKNLFDWTSRLDIRVFQGKPTVLLAASGGPGGATTTLGMAMASAPFFGYDVKANLSIPSFHDNFDPETGSLSNADLDARLRDALGSLALSEAVAS